MNSITKKKKEIVKGTIIYAIGSFGSKILSLLIVPLYTFFIMPEQLGIYDLMLVTVNLAVPIITFQITDAAYKWIADNYKERKHIISCTYWILTMSSILFCALCIFIGKSVIGIKYAVELALMLVVQIWFLSLQRLLRALKKQHIFVLSGIFQTFCFLVFIVVLVCGIKLNVDGLCISYIAAHFAAIVLIGIKCKELFGIRISLDYKLLKKMMNFSLPLIPNAMSWWLINSSDKYIIRIILGAASNGIYTVASKFPAVLQTINGLFYASWQDVAIREKSGEEREKLYSQTFEKYYTLMFGIVLVMIPATIVALPLIVSAEYAEAAQYSVFLYPGMVFQGFSSFFGINYLNSSKTMGATVTSFIAAIINLIADIVLMPFVGLHAAGISTFIGFFVMWLVRVYQTKNITYVYINKFKFLIGFGLMTIMTIVCIFANTVQCCVLAIIFGIIFLYMQRNIILNLIKKFISKRKQ